MTKQEAIERLKSLRHCRVEDDAGMPDREDTKLLRNSIDIAIECIEKQIPKKVEWAVDHTWGVEKEVPVCPTCDYYLTPIEFIDANICERTGHCEFLKVSYCEHCSQAIDWSDN